MNYLLMRHDPANRRFGDIAVVVFVLVQALDGA